MSFLKVLVAGFGIVRSLVIVTFVYGYSRAHQRKGQPA